MPPPLFDFFDKATLANSCHTLLEYFQHPAWIRCVEGRYLWVNKAFLKFFNVKMEQVIGKVNADFIPHDIAGKSYISEQEVLKKHCALTFRFNEKEYRTTVYKTPIFSNSKEIIAVAALMIDLTQELKLENQLHNTKEFYHSVLANMGEALFFINKNTHFEIINKKAEEILYEIGFKGPLTYEAWDKLFPNRYDKNGKKFTKTQKIILRALKGEFIINEEIYLTITNDCQKVFRASAIPFKNKYDNCILGVILTVTDITKEKNLLNNLAQKTKLVEQRNQELHQFAYSAAHDLRDPLRNISLSASLIYEKCKTQKYDEIHDIIERLLSTASYGGSLVKNLLDYSAANREMQMESVCLNTIMKQTINILSNLIEQAKAKITFSNLPTVFGNSQQLQIVFQNIISNAIRYKGSNPLTISISAQKKDSLWMISIQDNGPGINLEFKEEIFLPFKRLSANASSRSSGLGLSICRRIIDQHGGEIWLSSNSQRGACFNFTLKEKKNSPYLQSICSKFEQFNEDNG